MPYRTFIDAIGAEWQVWDIVPRLNERRSMDRRVEIIPVTFADRREENRRLTQARRAILHGSYAKGWLCFERAGEKRRLTPIPENWTTCSDELLGVYARHAEPVTAPSRMLGDFSNEAPLAETG